MQQHVYPVEHDARGVRAGPGQPLGSSRRSWNALKAEARAGGLWNLFLPDPSLGAGLSNLEYAPIAEVTGRSLIAPEVFNCNAPDTGNMEVLAALRYARAAGALAAAAARGRDPFGVRDDGARGSPRATRPTSRRRSRVTATTTSSMRASGGPRVRGVGPRCAVFIVMGVTNPGAESHRRHGGTMILVPAQTRGMRHRAPLDGVRLRRGRAARPRRGRRSKACACPRRTCSSARGAASRSRRGRLGPGRIHHCMRLIGARAARARGDGRRGASSRVAFGKPLAGGQGLVQDAIARSRCEIEQARLLTLAAAAGRSMQRGRKKVRERRDRHDQDRRARDGVPGGARPRDAGAQRAAGLGWTTASSRQAYATARARCASRTVRTRCTWRLLAKWTIAQRDGARNRPLISSPLPPRRERWRIR